MVAKFCSRSQGHPVFGVRSAAMISRRRERSREGVIARIPNGSALPKRNDQCGASRIGRSVQSFGGLPRGLMPAVGRVAARLEQEPGPALGGVDEVFEQARGGNVLVLV